MTMEPVWFDTGGRALRPPTAGKIGHELDRAGGTLGTDQHIYNGGLAGVRIAAMPYVADTLRLPDLHMKDGMEAPSSFVTATRGVIVPQLVSESINDGMGLLRTNVQVDAVSLQQLESLLRFVNEAGATTKLATTPYSWTPKLLERACREGAAPLLDHYGIDGRYSTRSKIEVERHRIRCRLRSSRPRSRDRSGRARSLAAKSV